MDKHQAKCKHRPHSSVQATEEEEKKEMVEEESDQEESEEEFEEQEVSSPRKRKFIKARSVYEELGYLFCIKCGEKICEVGKTRRLGQKYRRHTKTSAKQNE